MGRPAFSRNNRYNDGAFYAQDSWKVTPRLTLNWPPLGVLRRAAQRQPGLDSNFYLGPGSNCIISSQRYGADCQPESGRRTVGKDKNNLAPRVGFAWDIFGDGSTSLRGGYGMGYERNFGNVTFNVIQNPPNYAVVSLCGRRCSGDTLYTDNAGPLAGTGTKFLPAVSLRAVKQNIATAYTQFWSAAIDRQVMRNSVLSVEYARFQGDRIV